MITNNCVIYALYGIKIDLAEQNVFMIYNCKAIIEYLYLHINTVRIL